jgi:crooked neck
MSYAQFELSINDSNSFKKCREVYRKANNELKQSEEKEERLMLLEAWKEFEVSFFPFFLISR